MKDRLIQLVALVLLIAGVACAFLLTPGINQQRVERKLTYSADVGDNANPAYTFVSLLGPVRGVMVNILWQRSETLKQEGKFFEANNLAEMITTLQPRYPEAWNFQGWNMAYNISVKCKTAEERWDWVKKGMDLIRDRGIPNNPNGVVLYRSMAWILGHKMAGQTDDMHWYYKLQFAEQWHALLGAPRNGSVLKPEYRNAKYENLARKGQLDPLKYFDWAAVEQMRIISNFANTYLRKPDRPDDDYNASNYFATLSPAALEKFYEDYPAAKQDVAALEALKNEEGQSLGFGLNPKTLKALGAWIMYQSSRYEMQRVIENWPDAVGNDVVAIHEWAQGQNPAQLDNSPLLAMLRALTLVSECHMDPAYMLKCMQKFGPMDWRHPSAHACYWTALGSLRAEGWNNNKDRVDLVNANRAIIHALQNLAHYGRITFRPGLQGIRKPDINHRPDTRMIPAYGVACRQAIEKVKAGEFGEHHKAETYYNGHENFLQSATVLYYFEKKPALALAYYDKCKAEYGDREESVAVREGHYRLGLQDFIAVRLQDSLRYQDLQRIEYWIRMAYEEGVFKNNPAVTTKYLKIARSDYDKYHENRQVEKRGNPDNQPAARQAIPGTFAEIVINYFSDEVVRSSRYTMRQKSVLWRLAKTQMNALVKTQDKLVYRLFDEMQNELKNDFRLELPVKVEQEMEKDAKQLAAEYIRSKPELLKDLSEDEKKSKIAQLNRVYVNYAWESVFFNTFKQMFKPPVGYVQWKRQQQQIQEQNDRAPYLQD